MVAIQQSYLTPEAYLEGEINSPVKHEYWDGEVYAMAGASDLHVTISLNVASILKNKLRGTGCRVFISDMKARIESKNCFYYPDVMVSCDPRDRETPMFKSYPSLIVEVLSDSTEGFDRGDKFKNYRSLETLREYVVISQTHRQVDCFRRNADGRWELYPFQENDTVHLESVDLSIEMDALYEDVVFPEPKPQEEIDK